MDSSNSHRKWILGIKDDGRQVSREETAIVYSSGRGDASNPLCGGGGGQERRPVRPAVYSTHPRLRNRLLETPALDLAEFRS